MNAISPGGGGGAVPSYDPWSGDPSQFDTIVTRLISREDHATEIRVGINSLLGDPALTNWLGNSADAFRGTLAPLPNLLEQMADAYNQASTAVRAYARALVDGQASFAKVQASLQQRILADPSDAADSADAATDLANQAGLASAGHDSAKQACAKQVAQADDRLRQVKATLADHRFADFTATFTGLHGNLTDLAALQYLGMELYAGQLDALRASLDGTGGSLPPGQSRAEIQDMIDQYGANPNFWLMFGPMLNQIPGYLDQHDKLPDGSLPPEDQALLTLLGQATAKAAGAGDLNFLIQGTNGKELIGLSRIIASAPGGGKSFGAGDGAQFLADLVTKITDAGANSPTDDYGTAVAQALRAAAQNGDAVRLALSGPGGQQLATELLQGSVSLKEDVGTLGGSYTENVPPRFPDSDAIAEFLNAGLMTSRGLSPLAEQQIQAAYSVIRAAAAFHGWNPSDKMTVVDVGDLPPSVVQALIHYAANNSLDLAVSGDGQSDGIGQVTSGPGPPFYNFTVSGGEVSAFLALVLKDPKDAAAYRGYLQGTYSQVVSDAIKGGNTSNWTVPYASLLSKTQLLVDQEHLDAAQRADALSANRVMVFTMITGALGNAPGGDMLGLGQAVDGFVQPLAGSSTTDYGGVLGHLFDTSHTASAQQDAHQDDVNQIEYMKLVVTQGALDSGRLKPDMIDPGIVVDGKIVYGTQFQTWFETHGANLTLGPPSAKGADQPAPSVPSLQDYVNQIATSLEIHK